MLELTASLRGSLAYLVIIQLDNHFSKTPFTQTIPVVEILSNYRLSINSWIKSRIGLFLGFKWYQWLYFNCGLPL